MNNSNDVLSDMLDANEKDQDEHVECCICNGGENSADNLVGILFEQFIRWSSCPQL